MILRPISASAPLAFIDKGLWALGEFCKRSIQAFVSAVTSSHSSEGLILCKWKSKQLDSVYLCGAVITQIQTGLSPAHSQRQHIGELPFAAFPREKKN